MKRVLSLLIGMLMMAGVSAAAEPCTMEDIRRQADSPWQSVYETPWRTVAVSVQPTVPEVQEMPVLMVKPAFWVPAADHNAAWTAEIAHAELGNDTFTLSCGDIDGAEQEAIQASQAVQAQSAFYYAPLDWQRPYAPRNTLTISDMQAKVMDIMAEVTDAPCGVDWAHLFSVRVASVVDVQANEAVLPGALVLELPTTLRNIPLWGHVIQSIDKHRDDELFYAPGFFFTMRDEENYILRGAAVRETAMLAADVPLCPLERVIAALEPEITAGHIRHVFSLDLGLALFNEPGQTRQPGRTWMKTASFFAAPAWRCTVLYSQQAKKELPASAVNDPCTSQFFKTLYVDAQTGRLIDPNDGRKGCGDTQGFMPWEAVQ